MPQIEVGRTEQDPSVTRFHVRVTDDDGSATEHDVTSTSADLERLASGYPSPDAFIQACFEFLLERERKESILRSVRHQPDRDLLPRVRGRDR